MTKRIASLFLLVAIGGVLLVVTPRRAGADPNNANCKPNRATCTGNHQCCSGVCAAGLCAAPPPTTTTSTTPTTTSTTSSTTTSSTTTTSITTSTTSTTLRFIDNGDGTVTDNETGLQWEKKVAGSGCLHCVDDVYTWCVDADHNTVCDNGRLPDGTAFTSFLATLNGGATGVGNCVSSDGSTQTGGFNNQCDWRLPTIAELRTILDTSQGLCGGGSGACIDSTFGPTAASFYWSSTTLAGNPAVFAWGVHFFNGNVTADGKFFTDHVRAVRGGS